MLKIVSKVSALGKYVAKDVFNIYEGNVGEVLMGSVLKMLSARCIPPWSTKPMRESTSDFSVRTGN